MTEYIKEKKGIEKLRESATASALATQAGVCLISLIFSRAIADTSLLPFGVAFVAGCPQYCSYAAAIGAFAGYFIPAVGMGGFRYIAAILLVLAIKLLFSKKHIFENHLFSALLGAFASLTTCLIAQSGFAVSFSDMLAESFICGLGAFFVAKTFAAVKNAERGLSAEELAAVLIVLGITVSGLSRFTVFSISLGRILGILLILTAAKYGGILAGAVSGTSVAFCLLLAGNIKSGAIYYFGGLLAGIFSSRGKYAEAFVMAVCCTVTAIYGGLSSGGWIIAAECTVAIFIFMLLPRNAGIYLGKLFSGSPRVVTSTGLKKAVTMRLCLASSALNDISQTVEKVSKKLAKINKPDYSAVVNDIEQKACSGCKLRIHCFETKRDKTLEAIFKMTDAVKKGEMYPESFAPEEFRERCIRPAATGQAVVTVYKDYAAKAAAQNRIEEVRDVVSDQFSGISEMLKDLANELENGERFDNGAALAAVSTLKNLDIRASECSAAVDKYGRMSLSIKLSSGENAVINKLQVMKALSVVLERDFDIPAVNSTADGTYIVMSERPVFRVRVGSAQFSADGSSLCGDAYTCFNDGKGHYIMILSDGMGTGGRAAVDGAMASELMLRLLKSGFGYDCSLKVVNSSMTFKSADESLATMDIASIDLFTGQAELYKAGAAATMVRRKGRVGKAESTSLPIGILKNVSFDRAGIRLCDGDILLLVSDGVTACGTDWIREELESYQSENPDDIAERIAECARRRRDDAHADDITVIAAFLEKMP